MTFLLREVDFLALGTVDLDPGGADVLAHANREHVAPLAQHPRAHSEHPLSILVAHEGEALGSDDEAGVDQPVDVGGLLVDLHVPTSLYAYRSSSRSSSSGSSTPRIISRASLCERGVLVVVEHWFESVEVEIVPDVVLVDPAEELVVFQSAEPVDPPEGVF